MEKYLKQLEEMGAVKAQVIDPRYIVTAAWTHFKCQFGCGLYGKGRCCPPHTPDYQQTQAIIDEYQTAILFQGEQIDQTVAMAATVGRQLFLDGYYKAIALGCGPCKLCETCNLEQCNFPQQAIPSMEGCGIDVFATARNNGFTIETLADREATPHYFGLLLVE